MRRSLPPACVMGDLNVVRCLRRVGVPVALATSKPDHTNRLSRHCSTVIDLPPVSSEPDAAVAALLRYAEGQGERPVLFYDGDPELLFVSRHRDQLGAAFDFVVPPRESVEALVDKVRFHALASELGLPVPATALLQPGSMAAPLEEWTHFPCLIKPACRRIGWDDSDLLRMVTGRPKAIRIDDERELGRLLPAIERHPTALLLQAAIPGGEERIVSYHAYVTEGGTVAGDFTGRKIRVVPRVYGHSSCVVITADERLRAVGRDVVQRLSMQGVVKLDFKEDDAGELYLLEANPRFNLWHYPAAVAGVNLPAMVYRDLTGVPMSLTDQARPGVEWLSFLEDLAAFGEYRRAGELTPLSWLASLLRVRSRVYEGFAWDDPWPATVAFSRFALRMGQRAVRGRSPQPASPAPAAAPTAAER